MRPEIDDKIIERLKAWAKKNEKVRRYWEIGEARAVYSVQDALSDLLKEAGF